MANEEKISQLTPMEIHNKEFKRRGRKGYDRYEVDKFLDQVVDEYGDALDQVVDLKNKQASQDKKIEEFKEENESLKAQVSELKKREQEVNNALEVAKKSASDIKQEAEKHAKSIIANAKRQAQGDSEFEKQQIQTLKADYDRLKKEVGQFRGHLQDMLQKQIDNLSDEEWQHALDKYFNTPRYYPEDGSEPSDDGDNYDLYADEVGDEDDFAEDDIGEPDHIDKEDLDALESSEEPDNDEEVKSEPQPMTGDSPSHETVDTAGSDDNSLKAGPTIVFPDDYKEHN